MKRIYVAGKISDDTFIKALGNVRIGIKESVRLLIDGYAPFCPFIDFMYFLFLNDGESITPEQIKAYSLAWLPVCDAIYMLPNWKESKGAVAEKKEAERLGIPVFYDLLKMNDYFGK